MATFLDRYNFNASPFVKRTGFEPYRYNMGDSEYTEERPFERWELNPDAFPDADDQFLSTIYNPNNVSYVETDKDGNQIIKVKSADKEGTKYKFSPTGQNLGVVGSERWDTNENIFDDPIALAMMAAVATMGAGAAGAFGGAGGGAAGGAAGGTGAAGGVGSSLGGSLGGPMAGLLNSEALFLGASPEILAAAGINPALTSAAMGGAAGIGAGAPTMGSALTGALGAGGAGLTNSMLAGATGIGTSLMNTGGLAAADWALSSGSEAAQEAAKQGAKEAGKTSVAKGIANALGLPEWAIQGLGGLLGAGLGYADAKSQEGKKAGGAPETLEAIKQFQSTIKPMGPQPTIGGASGLLGKRQQFAPPSSNVMGLLGNINTRPPQVNNPFANPLDPRFWG